jgi:hypothetical protein
MEAENRRGCRAARKTPIAKDYMSIGSNGSLGSLRLPLRLWCHPRRLVSHARTAGDAKYAASVGVTTPPAQLGGGAGTAEE